MNDNLCKNSNNFPICNIASCNFPTVVINKNDNAISYINNSFINKFGIFDENIIGKKIEKLKMYMPKSIMSGETMDYCTEYMGFNIKVFAHTHDEFITLTLMDVTREHELLKNLSEIVYKYKNLISQTKTAFCICDIKGYILEKNEIFSEIVDEDSENVFEFMSGENTCSNWERLTENTSAKYPFSMEVEVKCVGKEKKWFELTANSFINGEDFNFVKIICLWKDITEKKEMDRKNYIDREKTKDAVKQKILRIRNKRIK